MIFDNRETAGRLLGEWLKEKLGKEGNYIVLGIPRGGVRALGKSAPAP
jgi:predicted phosphoribosyltransferase